jgi:hypothetical protein
MHRICLPGDVRGRGLLEFARIAGCAEPTASFMQGNVSQGGGRRSSHCLAAD